MGCGTSARSAKSARQIAECVVPAKAHFTSLIQLALSTHMAPK